MPGEKQVTAEELKSKQDDVKSLKKLVQKHKFKKEVKKSKAEDAQELASLEEELNQL
jgi:hypothetical protein